jgi:hypothetical protein
MIGRFNWAEELHDAIGVAFTEEVNHRQLAERFLEFRVRKKKARKKKARKKSVGTIRATCDPRSETSSQAHNRLLCEVAVILDPIRKEYNQ